ncbi:MAG TPA: MATE family efflux transporter [Chthonomonadaceae bacterium]|nr:MATE family efflux transporter [Chthonomonadaceae bacterium]
MPIPRPEPLDAERERPDPSPYVPVARSVEDVSAANGAFVEAPTVPAPILSNREIHREVWALAWPSVMTMLLQTVNSMMDVFFVGHLPNGASALAATGVGGGVLFLLISLAMGISVGTTALVARFKGAGEMQQATHATGQSLMLSLLMGLGFGGAFYLGRVQLIGEMLDSSANPEAARLGVQFLSIMLLVTGPLFLMNALMGAFRGLGDTRTPLFISFATVGTHITCNALLIYGRLGFPRMGVRGAATALSLSILVGIGLYLLALAKRTPLAEALLWKHLALRTEWAWRILKIGLPAALQAVIRTLAMMSFTGMLARAAEGAAGVAALQIGVRAESIAFMPGFGYSVAASALVGQSLGAKDPVKAEQAAWAATFQSVLVMSFMAMLFYLAARPFAQAFTGDVTVQALGIDYLRINAWCEPFLGLGMVLTGALQGAGDTLRPTYITFFTMWLVRLPLSWWLMFNLHLNAHGAWLSMSATTILGGLMTVVLFRAGTWKRIKV